MSNDCPYYERDGRRYDRITKVLDYFPHPDLVDWKIATGRKEARRVSTVAMKIGTAADEFIRASVEGRKLPKLKTPEAVNCVDAYRKWLTAYSPSLATVSTVFSEELAVAGTPDLLWGSVVVDIKCAASVKDCYWLQTEFYGRMIPGVTHKAILRLDKHLGIYEYKELPLSDNHWLAVRGAIHLYKFYNREGVTC